MSIRQTFGGNQYDPPEYESDNPVECLECSAEHDIDDDRAEFYEVGYDKKGNIQVVCRKGDCWSKWAEKNKAEAVAVAKEYEIRLPWMTEANDEEA